MNAPDIILQATGLKRWFEASKTLFGTARRVRAVDGVTLSVLRGETLAVVGESGCGKSTLARLLVRLMEPSEGSVTYDGRDIASVSASDLRGLRRDLQFIFQDPFSSLNPRMTVGALIEEPLRVHDIGTPSTRTRKVADLLTRVGLSPQMANRYPHEFSGGQRQRIGIARALASGPKVLIGDEPVSALDVSIQAQVINILEDLKDAFGLTLVIISHDLGVVRHMADRVAVMYLGEIVELAPVGALFHAPRHPYTAALIAAIPMPQIGARQVRARLDGDPPSPIDLPAGCRFHPRCPHASDICRRTAPTLVDDAAGHFVACHHAATLDLPGVAAVEIARSPTVAARFSLYRAASERHANHPTVPPSLTP